MRVIIVYVKIMRKTEIVFGTRNWNELWKPIFKCIKSIGMGTKVTHPFCG